MKRWHRRPRVAAERRVHPRPGAAPGLLPHLDHDPPHLFAGQALLGGPPRRRRGHREVADATDVEDGGETARGAREAIGMADEDEDEGGVGLEKPEPVDPGEEAIDDPDPGHPAEGALEAGVGEPAEAERAVGDDRVAGLESAAEPVGIVVGQLVDHREGPHLEHVEPDVALARSRVEHREGERARGTGGDRHRRGNAEAVSQERHGDRRRERSGRSGADHRAQRRRSTGSHRH